MFVAHCCLRVQLSSICLITFFFFFFNDTAPTEIYTLSLHDALPILSGATIPVEIHGGPGDDVIVFGGSGDAFILDRKSTRLNSSHTVISYAVFCLKKKKDQTKIH